MEKEIEKNLFKLSDDKNPIGTQVRQQLLLAKNALKQYALMWFFSTRKAWILVH